MIVATKLEENGLNKLYAKYESFALKQKYRRNKC